MSWIRLADTVMCLVGNGRPSLLVLTGQPALQRQSLLNFALYFREGGGAIIAGNVVIAALDDPKTPDLYKLHKKKGDRFLNKMNVCLTAYASARMRVR